VEIIALGSLKETEVAGKVQRTLVPGDYYSGNFTIQVGAFKDKQNAVKFRDKLASTYKNAHIAVYEGAHGTFYRVRVGRSDRLERAIEYKKTLEHAGYTGAMVVAE
jgi:rare lipoprotein A